MRTISEQIALARPDAGGLTADDVHDHRQTARNHEGHTVVVECGGPAIEHPHLRELFARDVAFLHGAGVKLVLVHGGGSCLTRLMETCGRAPGIPAGMGGTADETMVAVETALREVNEALVELLAHHRVPAAGFGGWETSFIGARRLQAFAADAAEGPGRVADVEAVKPAPLRGLLNRAVVPVLAPLGIGADAVTYRIDAELVAGEVAAVLAARRVIFLADAPGIMAPDGCRYRQLSRWGADALVREGALGGRMLPKVEGAVRALKGGAEHAQIADGRVPHALLRSLRSHRGLGTEIVL